MINLLNTLTGMAAYNSDYNYDGGAGLVALIFGVWGLFMLAVVILALVANWKLFEKAGVEGWWALIPFANVYKQIQIAEGESNTLLFLGLFVPFVNIILAIMLMYRFARTYTDSGLMAILYVFFPFITGLVMGFSDKYTYQNPLDGSDSVVKENYRTKNYK